MKNIYLIETKGKTNLFYDHSGFYWNKTLQTANSINSSVIGYNVYVTNDEKIITNDYVTGIEKDWGLYGEVHQVKFIRELPEGELLWFNTQCNGISANPEQCAKIIFTTDPELFLDVKNTPDEFLEYFCNESNKNKTPLEFIEISDGKFIYPNQLKHWTDAFRKNTDIKANLKIEFVSQLNEDGTETDITDKPELWHINKDDDFSIIDKSDSDKSEVKNTLYSNSLMENLQEIHSCPKSGLHNIIEKHTSRLNIMKENRSRWEEEGHTDIQMHNDDEKITLLASVLSDLNIVKIWDLNQQTSLDDMQYYMEYCQRNPYITPQEWLNNHKHY